MATLDPGILVPNMQPQVALQSKTILPTGITVKEDPIVIITPPPVIETWSTS